MNDPALVTVPPFVVTTTLAGPVLPAGALTVTAVEESAVTVAVSPPMVTVAPTRAVPVIVTLPAPVAEMLADDIRYAPEPLSPVPHEVPLTESEPELVVTVAAELAASPPAVMQGVADALSLGASLGAAGA